MPKNKCKSYKELQRGTTKGEKLHTKWRQCEIAKKVVMKRKVTIKMLKRHKMTPNDLKEMQKHIRQT